MQIFYTGLIFGFLGGVSSLFCSNAIKTKVLTSFIFIATVLAIIPAGKVLLSGTTLQSVINFTEPIGQVPIVIDALSAFFIIVISLMSFLGIVYSNGYLKSYIEKGKDLSSHCLFLSLLFCSMLAVVTIQNALFFLIVWEIMSLSSFFLVIFEDDKKEVLKAGLKYLIYMHISVIFLILMFVLLSLKTGSMDFNQFKTLLENNAVFANIIFLLGFIGFGIKAGFVPFHNWLPEAHPAAPSHVSGIMSGVMIKTGIYGILRMLTLIVIPSAIISYFVLIIALISALYGVLYALAQHDLKRLLAYHSIENIGIIGIGIGVGMLGLTYNNPLVAILGFAGGILHILNHSIFKELLFLGSGVVYLKTHTKNIEILGGLIKSIPWTAFLFLTGAIAICGLPPFNGFISEFLIYIGILKGLLTQDLTLFITLIFSCSGLAFVGTMAILCFTKAFSIVFLGEPRSENAANVNPKEEIIMLLPMGCLAAATLIIGLFPQYTLAFIAKPVSVFVKNPILIPSQITVLMQNISYCMFGFVAILAVLILAVYLANKKTETSATWGCGYDKPTAKMQYTASSYASPFLEILKPLFKRIFDVKSPKELFPKDAHFNLHIEDIEESYLLSPLVQTDEKFLAIFRRIQNGNPQTYILYGLIFLIVTLVGIIWIG